MRSLLAAIALNLIASIVVCPAKCQVVRRGDCVVDAEIWLVPQCALETRGDHLYVAEEYLPLFFSSGKVRLAAARLPGGWAYFDRRGLVVVQNVATMDNGASEFHHGLVRVVRENKWDLANTHGLFIVAQKYDGMLEYDESHKGWRACTGCRTVSDGEHSWFEGGEWYWLDRHGNVEGKAQDPRAPGKPAIR